MKKADWNTVTDFENKIAEFFGAPYAVSIDSCTHGIELCLRYLKADYMNSPIRTYLSVPMLASKLNIPLYWTNPSWTDYYVVYNNGNDFVYDAAVLWRKDSYIQHSFMCISFQYQKHLSLGRGGMILCNGKEAAEELRRMSYDGRERGIPWREQDIKTIGFHYYMTPETAQLGLNKLGSAIESEPRKWSYADYPDLTKMEVFK
jgi:dTDP-4-amino-4,6-dideoxygalactose transaminase